METDRFLGADWLGRRWSKSPRWVTEKARAGEIPGAMKVGRQWRFNFHEIKAYEDDQVNSGIFALTPGSAARNR